MVDKNSILELANKIRIEFDEKSIPHRELEELYVKYNPAVDIHAFIKHAEKTFPNLNCGLATVYLQKTLGEGKIVQGKYGENNHTFLMIEDIVVDITSDQYGGPKVYVGELKLPWSL